MEPVPLLQIALDCIDFNEALRIAELVHDYADILEIGTLLLKKEGIGIVEHVKRTFPEKLLFVDTKTIDIGKLEAQLMFDAGADIISVCGAASDVTIGFAIYEARSREKQVMIDLIGLGDSYRQVKRLSYLKPDYLTVYTSLDEQISENNLFDKVEIISQISPIPLAISGGIQLDDIPYLLVFQPAIIIVGAAIANTSSPRETAKLFHESIQHLSAFTLYSIISFKYLEFSDH